MTPPASTEPMYLISESELFDLDGTSDDEIVFNAVRARGPVQQAPAAHYCTHLKWLTQIEGDGDYRCELGNKTSCEWCEGKSRCGDYQSVHDAALIAQAIAEDRKLRPRPPCEECNWQERLEKEKAQARADVLRQIGTFAIARRRDGIACHLVPIDWVAGKLESLRPEVKK